MSQNRNLNNVDFQLIKDFLTDKWLLKNNILFYQMNHWFDYLWKVFYKSFIKITKTDEDLYFLQINKYNLIDNDLNLHRVYS